jgi:iron complex transport system substrate-binding protein
VLLLLTGACAAAAAPQRVMSLYLCSDQLLLELLPPSRITSVTYLSRERYESYLSAQAWRVGVNYGTAEEVIRERPDLVIAGLYTTPATRLLLKQVGIPLLELDAANSFQQIRDITRQVGRAVGAQSQAERLLQQMDATLTQLAASAPTQPIRVIAWDGSGDVYGKGTLFDAIISAAGATNLFASAGLRPSRFGIEQLLMVHADLLLYGDATAATPALHESPLAHPAVRGLYAGRQVAYPELLYSCGLPQSAQAALQLRQVMQQALRGMAP